MQTTGPASPDKPPVVDPEADDKVEEGARAKEDDAAKVSGEDEDEEEQEGRRGRRQRRRRGGAAGDSSVAMVKRELLARCLTCPLCDRLLRKATTISECLHTCESFLLWLGLPAPPPRRSRHARTLASLRRFRAFLRGLPATAIGFDGRLPRPWGYFCRIWSPGGAGTWVGSFR